MPKFGAAYDIFCARVGIFEGHEIQTMCLEIKASEQPSRIVCGGQMLASRRLRAAEDTNVFYVGSMDGAVDDVAAYTHNLIVRWAIAGE